MSLSTDQSDAMATIRSRDRRQALSTTKIEELKQFILDDSFVFAQGICNHRELVPEIHAPISYMACGLTDRLIETLDNPAFESYVTRYLRHEFKVVRELPPWNTPEGRAAIDDLLNGSVIRPAVINFRMSRRMFKSSTITHAGTLYIATVDPNQTIKITHAVDPKAWELCDQIAKTVLSGTYRDYFPERIPEGDLTKLVTMKKIVLGGRTISHPQTTIQASGIGTAEESAHYSTFVNDDLIADDELSVDEIKKTVKWQKGMTGLYMTTRPIRRLEVGTKHDEDDDDTFLTTGKMARECLTLRVPIEEYDGEVVNILERGRPTCPAIFPVAKIAAEQIHVLSGAEDSDGYRTWWNQYLLSAIGGGLRLFPASLVDDPDRRWIRVDIPVSKDSSTEARNKERRRKGHFIVARYARIEGKPIPKKDQHVFHREEDCPCGEKCDLAGQLLEDWREHAEIVVFDPWRQFDRVCLVDPSWTNSQESDNWAVSAMGCDYDDVAYQLHTKSDTSGLEGWIDALAELDDIYHFRVIGFDGAAAQDASIQNSMRHDKRLRRLASRMVKVPHNNVAKTLRMREGVAEPLKCYRLLLAPGYHIPTTDVLGGNMTRDELKRIKSTPKRTVRDDQDGIADSLAMFGAVRRKRRKPESDADDMPRAASRPQPHPALGVSYAA